MMSCEMLELFSDYTVEMKHGTHMVTVLYVLICYNGSSRVQDVYSQISTFGIKCGCH